MLLKFLLVTAVQDRSSRFHSWDPAARPLTVQPFSLSKVQILVSRKRKKKKLNFRRHSSQVQPLSGHADRDSLCLSTCRGHRVRCLIKCIVCYCFFTRASAEHKPCDKLNRPLVACCFVYSLSRVSNSQQFALKI